MVCQVCGTGPISRDGCHLLRTVRPVNETDDLNFSPLADSPVLQPAGGAVPSLAVGASSANVVDDVRHPPAVFDHSALTGQLSRMPVWASAVAFVILVAVLKVFVPLNGVFDDSTPTGGDVAGHVWFPHALKSMLPHLSGWSNDWFAGFPAGAMYFPIPALATVVLSSVFSYGVAMKITLCSGIVLMPFGAFFFARRLRLHPAWPVAAALATVAFQVERFHTIYGGNISSVFAGMFSLSIGFALTLFVAGSLVSFLNGSRNHPSKWLPWLLFATALSHLLAGVLCAVLCCALVACYPDRRRNVRRLLVPVSSAMFLCAVWAVPFLKGSAFATDMGYEPTRSWRRLLPMFFPKEPTDLDPGTAWWYWIVLPLALMSVVWAVTSRHRGLIALAVTTGLFGALYMVWPTTYVWDARWLPYWWWGLWMLAAASLVQSAAMLWRSDTAPALLALLVAVPSVAAAGFVNHLPGSSKGDVPEAAAWARYDLSGYEGRDKWPEYKQIMDTMGALGRKDGCGRAMWEYDKSQGQYGSPMAMMLLPYWTDGCVDSVEGLFMEGSQTSPFHFMVQHAVSRSGSSPVRDLPYSACHDEPDESTPDKNDTDAVCRDLDWGVPALRTLGVRWYMTYNPDTTAEARARQDLKEVAHTDKWTVFEVSSSSLVTALDTVPFVVDGEFPKAFADEFDLDPTGSFVDRELPGVFATPGDVLPPVQVSNVVANDDGVSFDVSKTGVPVMVHESWYPTWEVSGASDPVRAGGNMMIVVPTSSHVTLGAPVPVGRSLGEVCFFAGLVVYVFWVVRLRRLSRRRDWQSDMDPFDIFAARLGSSPPLAHDAAVANVGAEVIVFGATVDDPPQI